MLEGPGGASFDRYLARARFTIRDALGVAITWPVRFESAPGGGTTFFVRLPITSP